MEERNSFIVFDNDYLHQTYGEEIVNRLRNLFLSFRYDWRNDVSILNLLSMMFLFYPERSNLIHREYITLQFQTYSHLLRKYLQEIRHMNEKFLDLALKMDMRFFGPLTLELYDLNYKKKLNC
ncbi:nuclear hormone receptor-like protein [Euroglyphus maynei]|uniref:Nuclear hormone receptor-like protein n=1 Tax=Euroglyphus maynei TaxID=6958 RepID=A0A1Y3BID3_EURMA|nr:nuclear hormone receptor-like protein [Euroglyphus maynei]